MNKCIHTYCLLLTFLLPHQFALSQVDGLPEVFPPIILERTEIRILHSDIFGKDYGLQIHLPRNYDAVNKTYPVVYLMDSYRAFAIAKGSLDVFMPPIHPVPEVILAGIGYGGQEHDILRNWGVGRTLDLTPVKVVTTQEAMARTFEWDNTIWQKIGAFFLHLIPSFVLLVFFFLSAIILRKNQ